MFRYTPIVLALLACRTDKSITIQNPAPKAEIFSHSDGDTVLEGFATLFVGNVTDANHTADQLTTTWYLDGETICEDLVPDEDGETQCELTLGTESSEVTLAVLDADNARGETTIVVNVEPTAAPNAQIVTPTADGVHYSDQKITFEGLVSDAEDDPELLTAFWESDIDGVLSNVDTEVDSTGAVIGYEYLTEGEHAIELHVEDSTGKTARETVIVDVGPPNSAPLCELLTPVDGSAGPEGDVVTFTGTTSDVDVPSDWLTVTWSSDKDGELGTVTPDSSGNIVFSYSGLSVNTHTISLQVSDEVGATCTEIRTYTVGTPPSITIDTPINGDIVSEGSPISFSATVSDAQDQADEVALDWVANGTSISSQGATSSGTATFSDSALTYGTYNLVVTATDTDGLTDSDQINFTVNGLPTTPVVSITPSTPTTSDGLNVSIDTPSTDPEGNTVSYTYEWQLGGQVQSTQITSSLPSSVTSKGEQWTVVVTPNDGIADGVAGMASVVIGNTAPTVGAVTVTPAGTVYNDDVLTCSTTVTDPDETPTTTYEWTIGGVVVGAGSTLDLSTSGAMPGDTVVCTVTASDGVDTASNSGSQSIANRNPTITASITTNGSNQNAELTCVGTASDADGETPTVTYEWFNSSTSLGSANPLQLNSTLASSGDVIDCVTTATDVSGGSASATASHTVTNTAPVIGSVNVTPDPATVGQDDLTCTVIASDADGDSLLFSYEWSDSSGVQQTTTLISDTTDVYLASGTTEDTWTCEVTPYDGVDYGASDSASATVESGCPVGGDGSAVDCPSLDCAKILVDGHSVGDGLYWIDPLENGNSYQAHCLMDASYDGGGWTLISVHSDDGQDTWTWNNRHYFDTDNTTFGSLNALNEDFKSAALHDVAMEDILFIHSPSGVWAGYSGVDDGTVDFGTFSDSFGGQNCYSHGQGFPLSSGNLSIVGQLCSTEMFMHVLDRDGGGCSQSNGTNGYGPAWSASQNSSCPFDDPGAVSGLGPMQPIPTWENEHGTWPSVSNQPRGYGYGWAILGNSGTSGAAQNYMQVFVRREYIDADGDGYSAWEDCDDTDPTVWSSLSGGSATCAAETCKTIFDDGFSTGDGVYWIDPDGSGPFEVYCDMTTDGGGWTLAAQQIPTSWMMPGSSDYNIAYAYSLNDTFKFGNSKIQSLSPSLAWKIVSTDQSSNVIVDSVWFRPSCVVDWTVSVGLDPNNLNTDCGIGYLDSNFGQVYGGNYTNGNLAYGIGQNNNGTSCSIRMSTPSSTWPTGHVSPDGQGSPCDIQDVNSQDLRLWVK